MQNTCTAHVPYHSPIDSSRVSDNFRFLLTGGYHYKKKDRLKIYTCSLYVTFIHINIRYYRASITPYIGN